MMLLKDVKTIAKDLGVYPADIKGWVNSGRIKGGYITRSDSRQVFFDPPTIQEMKQIVLSMHTARLSFLEAYVARGENRVSFASAQKLTILSNKKFKEFVNERVFVVEENQHPTIPTRKYYFIVCDENFKSFLYAEIASVKEKIKALGIEPIAPIIPTNAPNPS